METKDLKELKEITGLVSASELKTQVTPDNAELGVNVGRFVYAKKSYGMIDAVHGNRLGFVHANKDGWTGELVNLEDCVFLPVGSDDEKKAKRSAETYFNLECSSLRGRIRMNYPNDNKERLTAMLNHVATWSNKLAS